MTKKINADRMWKVAEYFSRTGYELPKGKGKLNKLSVQERKDAFEQLQRLQRADAEHAVSRADVDAATQSPQVGPQLGELFEAFARLERNLTRRANPLGVNQGELEALRSGTVSPAKAKRLQRDALTNVFRLFNAAPERAVQDAARAHLAAAHGSAAAEVTSKSVKPKLDLHVERQHRADTVEALLRLHHSNRAPLPASLLRMLTDELGRYGNTTHLGLLKELEQGATASGDLAAATAAEDARALIRKLATVSVAHVQLEGGPIKAGGIRAYLNALTSKLPQLGHTTDVYLPLPGHLDAKAEGLVEVPGSEGTITDVHGQTVNFRLLQLEETPAHPGGAKRTFYFFADDTYFTPRRGLYNDEENKTDFADKDERLLAGAALAGAAMSKVAAIRKLGGGDTLTAKQVTAAEETLTESDVPDVIQYNDSHLAMLHAFLQHNEAFKKCAPLGIVHQGEDAYQTFIDRKLIEPLLAELGGNFAGALPADGGYPSIANLMALTMTMGTVSRGYLEQLLNAPSNLQSSMQVAAAEGRASAYPNGIDVAANEPSKLKEPLAPFDEHDFSGKAANKAYVQQKLGLSVDPKAPLFVFGHRIASQKGLQNLIRVSGRDENGEPISPLDQILKEQPDLQIVLGGPVEEPGLVPDIEAFAKRWPNNVRLELGYIDNQSMMAGADVFLMPSDEEPCGIAQIEAQLKGCAVFATDAAGFSDTVTPFNEKTGEGTAFIAKRGDADSYLNALRQAVRWAKQPDEEKKPMRQAAMRLARTLDTEDWARYQVALMQLAVINHLRQSASAE